MHLYWPKDKSQPVYHGPFQLNVTSVRQKANWTERIITLTQKETRQARSVVHLQFQGWPPGGKPDNVPALLQFIGEVHTFYTHQRSLMKPVVVHCSDGLGRTGAFCVIYTAVQEILHGQGIVGIKDKVNGLRMRRKWMVREKSHLQFCYEAVLHYAHDFLMKRGIVITGATIGEKQHENKSAQKPVNDPLFGADLPLSAIQSTVARMTLKERQEPDGGEQTVPAPHTSLPTSDKSLRSNSTPTQVATQSASTVSVDQSIISGDVTKIAPNIQPDAITSHSMPNMISNPAEQPTQNVVTSSDNAQIMAGTISVSGVVVNEQSNFESVSKTSTPLSLTDLQNPQTFSLGSSSTPPIKKKITKSDFDQQLGNINKVTKEDDPLSSLDPLWSIKK